MAQTNRRLVKMISSENMPSANFLPGKAAVELNKNIIPRRPALGEIKNQITNRDLTKKPTLGPVKPEIKITKSKTTSVTETQKEVKKVSTVRTDGRNVICTKKEESNTKQSLITKIETDCIIKEQTDIKSYSSQRLDLVEENDDGNDPQLVPEYVNEIFAYLRSLETKYSIDELFLACHKTTTRMRSVLINWLVDVHINFRLLPETLYLCVSIVDRFLQKNKFIDKENLQLVGITALFVAGKIEEIFVPAELSDFVDICDDSFSREEILRMELSIIKSLDYSFGRPLSIHFLRRYSKIAQVQPQHHTLAKYLLELQLIEYELCHVRPSIQAAAASCLSRAIINNASPSSVWTPTMVHYSTYTYSDIRKTVRLLASAVVKAETSKYQAIRKKYATSANGKISLSAALKGPIIKKLTTLN